MLRQFIFLLAVFYISNGMKGIKRKISEINIISTKNDQKINKNVLFISSNHRPDHFKMNCAFAKVLNKHYNVHFVILNSLNEKESEIMTFNQEYGKSYEIIGFSETLTNEIGKNREEIFKKYYKPTDTFESVQLFKIEAKIFQEIFEKKDFIKKYKNKYEIAFFDIMDTGALFLFNYLKIKNIFAINNNPLLPYQFEYVDKLITNKIPEFCSTTVDQWRVYYFNDVYTQYDNFQIQINYQYLSEKIRSIHANMNKLYKKWEMKYQNCLQKLNDKILNEINEEFKDEKRNDQNILVRYKNILKKRFNMEEERINDNIWTSVLQLLEKLLKIRKEYLINVIFEFLIKMGGFNYDLNQRLELQNKLRKLDDHKWSKFIQDTESEINEKITDENYILTKFPYFLEK